MRSGKIAEIRLQKVLTGDRLNAPDNLKEAIKGDMYEVLNAYTEVNPETVRLSMAYDGRGGYCVTFTAQALRIKGLK
jgi:septum formation topological specificity factor MinE